MRGRGLGLPKEMGGRLGIGSDLFQPADLPGIKMAARARPPHLKPLRTRCCQAFAGPQATARQSKSRLRLLCLLIGGHAARALPLADPYRRKAAL